MEISIKNFRNIENENYLFEDGLNLIKGESGKGKSTILEAIFWCLYGGKGCFPLTYQKERNFTKVKVKIFNLEITRTKPPEKTIVKYEKKELKDSEAEKFIEDYFGSKELFLASSYLKQNKKNFMIEGKDSEKRDLLKDLFFSESETVEKILQKLELRMKENKDNIEKILWKIENLEKVEEVEFFDNKDKYEKLSEKEILVKKELKKATDKLVEVKSLEMFLGEKDFQEKYEKELKTFPENLTLEKLNHWEEYKNKKEKLDSLLTKDFKEEKGNLKEIERKTIFLKDNLEKINISKEICKNLKIPYCEIFVKKEIEECEKTLEWKKSKTLEKVLTDKIERLNVGFFEKNILQKLQEESFNYDKLIEKVEIMKGKSFFCPSCNLKLIIKNQKLVEKKEKNISQKEAESYKDYISKIKELKEKEEELKLRKKIISYENFDENQNWEKRLRLLKEIKFFEINENLENLENSCRNIHLTQEKELIVHDLKKLESCNFKDFLFPENKEKYYRRYLEVKEKLEIISKLSKMEKSSNLEKRKETLEEVLKTTEIYRKWKKWINYKEKKENLETEVNLIKEDLKHCENLKKKIEETVREKIESVTFLVNEKLKELSKDLFFKDNVDLEIKMFKKLKNKEEWKSTCNLNVIFNGIEYDSISMLSGGELDRISLILTTVFSFITGKKIIILDESLASLNLDWKENCIKMIKNNLKDRIVVVTCHDIVEGYFDTVIEKQ